MHAVGLAGPCSGRMTPNSALQPKLSLPRRIPGWAADNVEGLENEDWFGWGEDVLAPCDCEVVGIRTNPESNRPGVLGKPPASSITFRREDDVHILYAHISSPSVAEGDLVAAGDVVAKVGNNGYSRQPHLHVGAWRGETALQLRFDQTRMNGGPPD
jgi:hypothetical protein